MAFTNLPKLQKVVIDGIDVSSFVFVFSAIEEFDKNIRVATIGLKSTVQSILDFNDKELAGSTVTIQRGVSSSTETYVFRGFVRKIDFESGRVMISCEDKLSEAKYAIENTSFHADIDSEAGVVSEIFKTLIADNTSLTADNTSVQNTGTVDILDKFILRQRVVYDALMELAWAVDYEFYYDPNEDKVFFQPKGFRSSTTILEVGVNVVEVPKWDIDTKDLFNKITVKGSQEELRTEEGPHILDGVAQADWTTTSITLNNKPLNVKLFSDTSNPPTTEKEGGVTDSSSTFDYEIDVETSRIIWSSTFTPTTSFYALVQYSYNVPVQVTKSNPTSITLYTGGIPKQISQFREDLKTVSDAERWATKQLNIYSEPFYKTTLKVANVNDLEVGTLHTITDDLQAVSRTLMIKSIKYSYPYRYDEVMVADREWRTANWGSNTVARLKRLEEKKAETESLINTFIEPTRDFRPRRRIAKILSETFSSGFILGHPTFGVLGTAVLGGSFSAQTTVKLIQGNMTYDEYAYDEDFHDSVNSTATFTTGTQTISFTSGQVWFSEAIDIGTTLGFVTVNLGDTTGTLKIEISSDNKATWQEVTETVRTAVTTSDGTGTYVRITEDAATTASITNSKNAVGEITHPVVKILMEE